MSDQQTGTVATPERSSRARPANERPYRFEVTDARQALKQKLISRRRRYFEAINRIDAALIALGPKLRDAKTLAAFELVIREFENAGI